MNIKKLTLILLSMTIGTVVPQSYALSINTKQELITELNHVADALVALDNALQNSDNPLEVLINGISTLESYTCSIDPFCNLDVGQQAREHATCIYNTILAIIDGYGRDNNLEDYATMLRIAKQYTNNIFNPLLLVYHDHRDAPKSAARINKELFFREKKLQQLKEQTPTQDQYKAIPTEQQAQRKPTPTENAQKEESSSILSNLTMPALLAAGMLALNELYAYNSDNGNSILAPIFNKLQTMFGNNESTENPNEPAPSIPSPSRSNANVSGSAPTPSMSDTASIHTDESMSASPQISTGQSSSSSIRAINIPVEKKPAIHIVSEDNTLKNSAAGVLFNSENENVPMPSAQELLDPSEVSRDEDVLANDAASSRSEIVKEEEEESESFKSVSSFQSCESEDTFYMDKKTMIQNGVGGLAEPSHNFDF